MSEQEILAAIEFGYKCCEKGWNLQKTLEEYKIIQNEPHPTVLNAIKSFLPEDNK